MAVTRWTWIVLCTIAFVLLTELVEATVYSCLLATPSQCSLGTFLLRDLQSNMLGGACSCVPCLIGTYRAVSSNALCTMSADFNQYIPIASQAPQTRAANSCTYFQPPSGGLTAVYNQFQSLSDDAAQMVDPNGNKNVKVSDYWAILQSSYLWGNMRQLRNAQKSCGQLRFNTSTIATSLYASAPKPGGFLMKFNLLNGGQLPINFTFAVPDPFLSVLTATAAPATDVQVAAPAANVTYQVQFDTSLVPSSYEWTNQSGFSAMIQIKPYQYWDQFSPRTYEPVMNLTIHVAYIATALYITPNAVEFNVRLGDQSTQKVTVMNLVPAATSYTVAIQYDSSVQFLLAIPGKSLNGSGQCLSGSPVVVPSTEYTSIVDIVVSAASLPVGRYGASVVFIASGSASSVRVSMNVQPGLASIPNSLLELSQNSPNLTVTSSLEVNIRPRDALNQTSFDFDATGSLDPQIFVFNVSLTPLFACVSCSATVQPQFLMGKGYSAVLTFPFSGLYRVDAYQPDGAPVIGSPVELNVQPVNCKDRDLQATYNTTSGSCECNDGYGEVLNEDPYVLCEQCGPGTYSSSGECLSCPLGTFSSTWGASQCISCEDSEDRVMAVELDPFLELNVGTMVDLLVDPFDSVPDTKKDGCVQCPMGYIANSDVGVCVPCLTSQKLRKVVEEIVSQNSTTAIIKWRYSCVCKAEFFLDDPAASSSCVACPTGAYCLGKTRQNLLPLQGFWKSPWGTPGANIEKCRSSTSCPGVYLEPIVLQLTDAYLVSRERAYMQTVNQTIEAIQSVHGGADSCDVQFVCDVGFAGPLCNNCDVSYTQIANSGCTKCIPQPAMIFIIAAGIVVALVVTAFIVRRTIVKAREQMEAYGSFHNGGSFRQGSFTVENFAVQFTDEPARASSNGPTTPSDQHSLRRAFSNTAPPSSLVRFLTGKPISAQAMKGFRTRHEPSSSDVSVANSHGAGGPEQGSEEVVMAKILISHLQEASMSISFAIAWPIWVAQMFNIYNIVSSAGQTLFSLSCLLSPTASTSDQIGGACLSNVSVQETGLFDPTRPLTFFLEAIFVTVIPFVWALVAAVFWIAFYYRGKRVHRKRRGKSAWNFYLLTLIVLVFLLYPTLSRTALRFYSCSGSFSGYRFLEADFNVVCLGPTHVAWMATLGSFMIICFAAGIPASILYVLHKHHSNMTKYRPVFGFVYLGYREGLYFWECVIMIRKLLFSICAVIISPLGADIQGYCGLAVLLIFLQLQTTLKPYESPGLNRAESFGLMIRFSTILLGLAINSKNSSGAAVATFGAFIIIINSLYILYSLRIFYRALNAVRKQGMMVALGLSSRQAGGFMKSESATPRVSDAYRSDGDREREQSRVFESNRELSVVSDRASTAFSGAGAVNPVFVNETQAHPFVPRGIGKHLSFGGSALPVKGALDELRVVPSSSDGTSSEMINPTHQG